MASKLTNCKSCNSEMYSTAKQCLACGTKNKKPFYKQTWFIVLAVLFVFGLIGGSTESDTTTVDSNNTTNEQQETLKDDEVADSGQVEEQETPVETEVSYDDPINWKWNITDTDFSTNGNLQLAIKASRENIDYEIYQGRYVDGVMLSKAPWNYYGQPIILAGYIYDILEYPPGGDLSNGFYNGNAFFEISLEALDGTMIIVFVEGSSGTLTYNEYIEVTGFVTGLFTGANAFGGEVTNVVFAGSTVYR